MSAILLHTLLMLATWAGAIVVGWRLVERWDTPDDDGDGGTPRPDREPPVGPSWPARLELHEASRDELARSA
jgi:hypothetical protein